EGVLTDELFELRDDLAGAPEREVGVDPLLERGKAPLLQPLRFERGELLVDHVCEGCAAPERERGLQARRRPARVTPREQLPLLRSAQKEPATVAPRLDGAQDAEVHVSSKAPLRADYEVLATPSGERPASFPRLKEVRRWLQDCVSQQSPPSRA